MRDEELLIELLKRMANDESGYILVRQVMGRSQKERHHADLLVDAGHAAWISESAVRITASGYDFLNALEKQPRAKGKFLELVNKGIPYANAALRTVDFVSKLTGSA